MSINKRLLWNLKTTVESFPLHALQASLAERNLDLFLDSASLIRKQMYSYYSLNKMNTNIRVNFLYYFFCLVILYYNGSS